MGSQTAKMSLLMIWVETIAQEMIRLVNWPILSITLDTMGQRFLNRMARDACSPSLSYIWNSGMTAITGVTVSTNGNTCPVTIPVTFPGTATTSGSTTKEQIGSDRKSERCSTCARESLADPILSFAQH